MNESFRVIKERQWMREVGERELFRGTRREMREHEKEEEESRMDKLKLRLR